MLCASGLFHVVVWALMGGSWEGSVSWRKPILFGISSGLTVISLGWLIPKLRPNRWDAALSSLFCLSLMAEVALITIQQWRGVASHFNRSTLLDSRIETWMTILISVVFLVLLEFTRRSFQSLKTSIDLQRAIRAGLMFLILSCVIGFAIAAYGHQQLAVGNDPAIIGKAGVAKFPHGLAIHAIQIFPMICWIMKKAGMAASIRRDQITWCICSMTLFLTYSLLQTVQGRARFDVDMTSLIPMVLSAIALLPPIGVTLRFVGRQIMRRESARTQPLQRENVG